MAAAVSSAEVSIDNIFMFNTINTTNTTNNTTNE